MQVISNLLKYIAMFNLDALFQSSLDSGLLLPSNCFVFFSQKGDLMLYAANIKLMLLKFIVKFILTDHTGRNVHAVI